MEKKLHILSREYLKNNSHLTNDELPVFTFCAIQDLGGKGSNNSINKKVYEVANITDTALKIPHGETGIGEVDYRILFSLHFLNKVHFIKNVGGEWRLTNIGCKTNSTGIRQELINLWNGKKEELKKIKKEIHRELENLIWKTKLLDSIHNMAENGKAFEELIAVLLTKMKYIEIKLRNKPEKGKKKKRDRGIDGEGFYLENPRFF